MQTLRVYEMNYGVSPMGVDAYEVYTDAEIGNEIIASLETLMEAVEFCYEYGTNFTIFTLEAWEQEYGQE